VALALFQLSWEGTAAVTAGVSVIFSAGGVYAMFRNLKNNALTKADLLGMQKENDARYVSRELCNERHKEGDSG
jgi:hypothetical protein